MIEYKQGANMRESLALATAPASEPVTVAEAKTHMHITSSDEDTYISNLITVARLHCERITQRAFITQYWTWKLSEWPEYFDVPRAPLQAATINYLDVDGNSQTLATSVYTVDTNSDPGRIYKQWGQFWPAIRYISNGIESVTVNITAGYGTATEVPQPIKQAILMTVANLYENRENTSDRTMTEIPGTARALLAPYRVWSF
jgi:uncharacterized phiE125 gp8 family phage protein